MFDDDETGKISFKNLKRVAKELGESMTDDELAEMIEEADRDGDGEINEEEFLRIMKKTSLVSQLEFSCPHASKTLKRTLARVQLRRGLSHTRCPDASRPPPPPPPPPHLVGCPCSTEPALCHVLQATPFLVSPRRRPGPDCRPQPTEAPRVDSAGLPCRVMSCCRGWRTWGAARFVMETAVSGAHAALRR